MDHECDRVHARDNEPCYRDEQRAWYDTLRDILPVAMDGANRSLMDRSEACEIDSATRLRWMRFRQRIFEPAASP